MFDHKQKGVGEMTQTKILLNAQRTEKRYAPEFAEAIDLTCDEQEVVLRFLGDTKWGQQARSIRINRQLAEELSKLLNYELDITDWRA